MMTKIPESNFHTGAPDDLHMEIMDTRVRQVWQVLEPVARDEFQRLVLSPPFVKIGVGRGAMDGSYFRRSPGAETDGPMETMEYAGYLFSLCARPVGEPELPAGPEGPRRLLVDKHHTVIYRAGSPVRSIEVPDTSRYVQVIEGGSEKTPLALPDGWTLHEEKAEEERIYHLPAPCTVFFFANGDSYQGPV